jgi:ribosomal RNA-processing protein 17
MRRQNRIADGDEDAGLSSEDDDDEDKTSDTDIMWDGISDNPAAALAKAIREEDAEAEYIDEDRYTTVTVEAMGGSSEDEDEEIDYAALDAAKASELHAKRNAKGKMKPWQKKDSEGNIVKANKVKKKKFRYESKAERAVTNKKQKSKNAKAAKSRRDG